jgi:hypothetical protein
MRGPGIKQLRRVIIAAGVVTARPATPATLHVPSEYSTIQAGIDAAAPGDTVLVAPGTYTDYEVRYFPASPMPLLGISERPRTS